MVLVAQAFPPHHFLRLAALTPARLRRLVATDVDVAEREEVGDLAEDILEERERRVGRAVDDLGDPPGRARLGRRLAARQLGVRGEGRGRVPGELDLR